MSANARIIIATLLLVLGLPAGFWAITLTVEIVKVLFTADVTTNGGGTLDQILAATGWLICTLSVCGMLWWLIWTWRRTSP